MTQKLTRELLDQMIRDELAEAKAKKKKPTCSSREDGKGMNRFHDEDGRFSSKANAKSSSVRDPKTDDCKYAGQARMPGEKITRIKCGRKYPKNPDIKADYRCKDGSKLEEAGDQTIELLDEPTYPDELKQLGNGMAESVMAERDIIQKPDWRSKYRAFIESLTQEEQRQVKQAVCSYDPIAMAKIINQFAKALDGKLDEPAN